MAGVWVYAERDGRGVAASALELLTKARSLSKEVTAVVLGAGAIESAEVLGAHGATIVLTADDAVYDDCVAGPAAYTLAQLVRERRPDLVLFAPGYESRDVAGRLQAILGCALVANVDDVLALDRVRMRTALRLWPGRPGNLRGGVGGTKLVDVALAGPAPRLVVARAKAFRAERCGGGARVVPVDVAVPEDRRGVRRVARVEDESSAVRLEDARVVIAGGRGLENAANFALLHELARAVGDAAVGATRPVVDAGWVPFGMQIGQTGKTVGPEVYLAVGISGAAQHVVGIKDARRVVAINKDRDAPIFQLADLGVVGDALEILPAVIAELGRVATAR